MSWYLTETSNALLKFKQVLFISCLIVYELYSGNPGILLALNTCTDSTYPWSGKV